MDRVLSGLKPEKVFTYFEDISRIPHGSYNTKGISDYCAAFARERGLWFQQDELNNVIIKKPASRGYEAAPGVILQGHLDMVAEKEAGSDHDFTKDPLRLKVEDGYVTAEGTTLGGDDGIAVAMMLAILDEPDAQHPELTCIFTTEEEVGMEGAAGIDLSAVDARLMINLDSEAEGVFTVGCAGGMRTDLCLPVNRYKVRGAVLHFVVEGLIGGHSGTEINKGRANACRLLTFLLYGLEEKYSFAVISMEGGSKDNAIPVRAEARIAVEPGEVSEILEMAENYRNEWKSLYGAADPNASLQVTVEGVQTVEALIAPDQEKVSFLLLEAPCGVQAMSTDIPGLVETSLNLGVLRLTEDALHVRYSLRSSKSVARRQLRRRLEFLVSYLGGTYEHTGVYPAWEYKRDSVLRDLCTRIYREKTGQEPVVEVIHAGLECGLLSEKLPGLDCVSIGPELIDIHTPRERMGIASVGRLYDFVLEVLREIKA